MNYNFKDIGTRVSQLRKSAGMTQEKLAERLNMSTDHLGKIETGKHRCSLEILIDFSVFFNVSLDYLVFGKKDSDVAKRVDSAIAELLALREML